MKIVLDAGHGPNTPGKRCPDDSMREYTFNSAVARYVAALLSEYEDVATLFTFEDSRDVPLIERTNRANAWGADAYVSIHANASGSVWSSAHGIETFTYTTKAPASVKLANAVQKHLIAETGRYDRGVKADNLHVLRESRMPAILVECGFMTNMEEAALLKSDVYRRLCAKAIVDGIVEVYGLKRKEAEVNEGMFETATVYINGKKIADGLYDEKAGVTYVPVRAVTESLGASVKWNGKVKRVDITK